MMGTEDLNSHLPAALRFARGLTRSRREGEALVETTLRELLEGSARLDRDLTLPAAVFECLYRSWFPVDAPHGRHEAEIGRASCGESVWPYVCISGVGLQL